MDERKLDMIDAGLRGFAAKWKGHLVGALPEHLYASWASCLLVEVRRLRLRVAELELRLAEKP